MLYLAKNMKINNDKIELFNGIALLKDDQCICRFIRESGRLDHDQNMLPLLKEFIKNGDVVLDIGAFIGDHTIYYSKLVGDNGSVIAFEPNRDSFFCLEHNLKAYKNVELINSAIGKEYGFVRTVDVLGNIGMNFLIPDNLGGIVIYSLNQMEIDRIDFIKIDVEGFELDVLIGAKETINKFKPIMVIEINDATLSRQGISRNDIFAWLQENNYIYRNIYKEQGLNDSQLDIICTPK